MAMQIPKGEIVETADQRVVMHNVTWDQYQAFQKARGERSTPRMVYLDGALELMTTSRTHEQIKDILSRLLEVYMVETGMDFGAYGHYTMELPEPLDEAVAIEADECYLLGLDQSEQRWPDLALEVIWTSGGINKLEAYRRLGVREVWFWIDGEIEVHQLVGGRYEHRDRSELVPGIDLAQLASYLDEPVLSKAIRAYGDALRAARCR